MRAGPERERIRSHPNRILSARQTRPWDFVPGPPFAGSLDKKLTECARKGRSQAEATQRSWRGGRLTLFVEVANLLDRRQRPTTSVARLRSYWRGTTRLAHSQPRCLATVKRTLRSSLLSPRDRFASRRSAAVATRRLAHMPAECCAEGARGSWTGSTKGLDRYQGQMDARLWGSYTPVRRSLHGHYCPGPHEHPSPSRRHSR